MTRAGVLPACLFAATLATTGLAVPADQTPDVAFAAAYAALERGAFDEAVDRFEALADGGFAHPDATFDRAAAYLGRARSPQARPGDLGQAVAALAEVESLRPGDGEAVRALGRIRAEIANRRVRAGLEPAVVSPALGRAVVGLVDETVWVALAGLGSLLCAAGLGAWWVASRAGARLGAGVTASVGAGLLLVAGGFAAAAGYYRRGAEPAVVVVAEARLLTSEGTPLDAKAAPGRHRAAPEGAQVYVIGREGRLLRVEWGTYRAFVAASDVRQIARR